MEEQVVHSGLVWPIDGTVTRPVPSPHEYVIVHAFTPEECGEIIALQKQSQHYWEVDSRVDQRGLGTFERMLLEPKQAEWVFNKLGRLVAEVNAKHFGFDLLYLDDIQLTWYDASCQAFFAQHVDATAISPLPTIRKISITLQLSRPQDYSGGELVLYPFGTKNPIIADKGLGVATIFRSHIIHEVTPVTSGKRYSLAVWAKGPSLR